MNLKRALLIVFVLFFIFINAYAQSADMYMVVTMSNDGVFTFTNNNFSLAPARPQSQGLSLLCNYMHDKGYIFVQMEYISPVGHNHIGVFYIIFKKK
jgi:hypothetical protein